jgi:predicted ester cyclase
VPGHDSAVGIESIKAFFISLHDAVPDMRVTIHDLIAEGDKVAARFTANGMQTKELLGQPAGQDFAMNGLTIYRLENGKIAEVWS